MKTQKDPKTSQKRRRTELTLVAKQTTNAKTAPKVKSCRVKRCQRNPRPQSRVKARKGRTKMVVKPINFSWDELLGHETALREDAGNGGLLICLEGER